MSHRGFVVNFDMSFFAGSVGVFVAGRRLLNLLLMAAPSRNNSRERDGY